MEDETLLTDYQLVKTLPKILCLSAQAFRRFMLLKNSQCIVGEWGIKKLLNFPFLRDLIVFKFPVFCGALLRQSWQYFIF